MIQKFQQAERIYIPNYSEKTDTMNLKNILSENYEIPDGSLERINEFISNDRGLEKIIFELPSLIQKKTLYINIKLKFYDEFKDKYLQLEVNITTSLNTQTFLKVEYELEQQLYELFEGNSADNLLLIME